MNPHSTESPVAFDNPLNLNQIQTDCWDLLISAVNDRSSGWRLPVMCTSDGLAVRQRILVLRQVDRTQKILRFHTHRASPKVASLRRNPEVSLLFYETQRQIQMQLCGHVTLHTDDAIAEEVWAGEPESSLRGYLAPLIPGTVCSKADVNLPEDMRYRLPTRQELAAARQNFAVLTCHVRSAEVLLLRSGGNIRCRFLYDQSQQIKLSEWLAP